MPGCDGARAFCMHLTHFGDSYDVVKQAILRWLTPFGSWAVHPMFTHAVTADEATRFAAFLGADLVSSEILTPSADRAKYFRCCAFAGNLLLDPTVGVATRRVTRARAPEYLFVEEFAQLAQARPSALTVVFDQSLPRGSERAAITAKLRYLESQGVVAFAYVSHASFIIAAATREGAQLARERIFRESRLPTERFVALAAA